MCWMPDHEEWQQISEPLWSYHFLEDQGRAYESVRLGDVALFVKAGILGLETLEEQAQAEGQD